MFLSILDGWLGWLVLAAFIAVALMVLAKLFSLITWPWEVVLAPLWIPMLVIGLIVFMALTWDGH